MLDSVLVDRPGLKSVITHNLYLKIVLIFTNIAMNIDIQNFEMLPNKITP